MKWIIITVLGLIFLLVVVIWLQDPSKPPVFVSDIIGTWVAKGDPHALLVIRADKTIKLVNFPENVDSGDENDKSRYTQLYHWMLDNTPHSGQANAQLELSNAERSGSSDSPDFYVEKHGHSVSIYKLIGDPDDQNAYEFVKR